MDKKKVAIILASIIGVAGLSYLTYWWYKKMRSLSGNPVKDNRNIKIVRTDK
jgi:hypothetical protein